MANTRTGGPGAGESTQQLRVAGSGTDQGQQQQQQEEEAALQLAPIMQLELVLQDACKSSGGATAGPQAAALVYVPAGEAFAEALEAVQSRVIGTVTAVRRLLLAPQLQVG